MKIVRAIIYIFLVIVVLVTGFKTEEKLNEYRTALDIKTKRTMEVRKGRNVDFEKLKAKNPDVIGWIYLPDSAIDYPVVQGEDNDYYLHRDLDGSYLYDGCIFADATNREPFKDFNTVIYGHRMMSGAMFASLKYFADKDYMDSHRIIQIETPEKSYDLHVVAFCSEDTSSDLYTTWFGDDDYPAADADDDYEYADEEDEMSDDTELDYGAGSISKEGFVELIRIKADVLSGEAFSSDDTFVTLSTCVFAEGDERIQVIGVLKDAAKEEKTTSTATKKPFVNKWLIAQIAVGILMLLVIVLPLVPDRRKRK